MQTRREPIFNIPAAIVIMVIILTAIHSIRLLLGPELNIWTVYAFGFVPARYDPDSQFYGMFPAGVAADVWTFVTYALLHGDWVHLGVNVAWMVAFGTPVLRRLGTARFLALSLVAAIAGAGLHLAAHWGQAIAMVGASAAISGQMGAAVRFAFQRQVLFGPAHANDNSRWQQPALPLMKVLRDIRVFAFVVVWFAVNLVFGATDVMPGLSAQVAWQAHVGGFLVGLLLFPLFDITAPHARSVDGPSGGARVPDTGTRPQMDVHPTEGQDPNSPNPDGPDPDSRNPDSRRPDDRDPGDQNSGSS